MTEHASLFTSVAALAAFHPQAKALRFWHDIQQQRLLSQVQLSAESLPALALLEKDIALVSSKLTQVVATDFHGFCHDISMIFNGAQPTGPVAQHDDVDWPALRRISVYAQHWRSRNPSEVHKLKTLFMVIPLYSCLVGEFIMTADQQQNDIVSALAQPGSVYIIGVKRFRERYQHAIFAAFSEAKARVSVVIDEQDEATSLLGNNRLSDNRRK